MAIKADTFLACLILLSVKDAFILRYAVRCPARWSLFGRHDSVFIEHLSLIKSSDRRVAGKSQIGKPGGVFRYSSIPRFKNLLTGTTRAHSPYKNGQWDAPTYKLGYSKFSQYVAVTWAVPKQSGEYYIPWILYVRFVQFQVASLSFEAEENVSTKIIANITPRWIPRIYWNGKCLPVQIVILNYSEKELYLFLWKYL